MPDQLNVRSLALGAWPLRTEHPDLAKQLS